MAPILGKKEEEEVFVLNLNDYPIQLHIKNILVLDAGNVVPISGLSFFFFETLIISRYSLLECGDECVEKTLLIKRFFFSKIKKAIRLNK